MQIGLFEIMLIVSTLFEFNPIFQAFKMVKSKNVKEVSFLTFLMIFLVGAMWLIYGIKIGSLPLIIGNAIKLFTSLCVLIIYFKYKKFSYKKF